MNNTQRSFSRAIPTSFCFKLHFHHVFSMTPHEPLFQPLILDQIHILSPENHEKLVYFGENSRIIPLL